MDVLNTVVWMQYPLSNPTFTLRDPMGDVWAKFPEVHYMSMGLGDSGEVGDGGESGRGNVAQKLENV